MHWGGFVVSSQNGVEPEHPSWLLPTILQTLQCPDEIQRKLFGHFPTVVPSPAEVPSMNLFKDLILMDVVDNTFWFNYLLITCTKTNSQILTTFCTCGTLCHLCCGWILDSICWSISVTNWSTWIYITAFRVSINQSAYVTTSSWQASVTAIMWRTFSYCCSVSSWSI